MKGRSRALPSGLSALGGARPSLPVSIFGEDFSLLIRRPRRLRIARGMIRVLN
jgi:hypothetical protein